VSYHMVRKHVSLRVSLSPFSQIFQGLINQMTSNYRACTGCSEVIDITKTSSDNKHAKCVGCSALYCWHCDRVTGWEAISISSPHCQGSCTFNQNDYSTDEIHAHEEAQARFTDYWIRANNVKHSWDKRTSRGSPNYPCICTPQIKSTRLRYHEEDGPLSLCGNCAGSGERQKKKTDEALILYLLSYSPHDTIDKAIKSMRDRFPERQSIILNSIEEESDDDDDEEEEESNNDDDEKEEEEKSDDGDEQDSIMEEVVAKMKEEDVPKAKKAKLAAKFKSKKA